MQILNDIYSEKQSFFNMEIEKHGNTLKIDKQNLMLFRETKKYLKYILDAMALNFNRVVKKNINFKSTDWECRGRAILENHIILYYKHTNSSCFGEDKRSVSGHGGTAYFKSISIEKAIYMPVEESDQEQLKTGLSLSLLKILPEGNFGWILYKNGELQEWIIQNLAMIRRSYESLITQQSE
jgi:hypothetical protein